MGFRARKKRREITCDDRKTYLIYAISLVFIPLSYEDSNGRRFSLSTFDSNLRILRPRTLFYSILCRMLTCKERLLLLVMYSGYCNSGYSVLSWFNKVDSLTTDSIRADSCKRANILVNRPAWDRLACFQEFDRSRFWFLLSCREQGQKESLHHPSYCTGEKKNL